MGIDFYMMPESPPCRVVQMVAKHLNVPLNEKLIDLFKREHLNPEFVKMNPQHSLPTIVDNGYILWESHAIIQYLVNKYAPKCSLYPEDPEKRGKVDLMLHFDNSTLDKAQRQYFNPLFYDKDLEPEKEEVFKQALELLDKFLSRSKYVAGDNLSLADISILGNLTYAEAVEYDISGYKYVTNWIKALKKELPYYSEINQVPTEKFTNFLKMKKMEKMEKK